MRSLLFVCALLVSPLPAVAQQNPFVGTWKLNPTKSRLPPAEAAAREMSAVVTERAGVLTMVTTVIGRAGDTVVMRASAPSTGDLVTMDPPASGQRTLTRLGSSRLEVVTTVKGVESQRFTDTISPDGRTYTRTLRTFDGSGRMIAAVFVLEKQ